MVFAIARPKLEGSDPPGRAIFWLHGTPGARRQIPTEEARVYAEDNHIRLIGVDRPGICASTPPPVVFARDWGFWLDQVKVPVRPKAILPGSVPRRFCTP